MNNWHWLRVCGDRTQFCHMQDDFTWEDFDLLGWFLGLLPVSLLKLSNCGHKKGTAPEAGVMEHRHGKTLGRDWLQVCAAGSGGVGRGTGWVPAVGSCLPVGAAAPAVRPPALHSAAPAGMTWAACKTNSNLLVPDGKFAHCLEKANSSWKISLNLVLA